MTVLTSDCAAEEELVSGCVSEDRYISSSYFEQGEINVDPIDTEIYPFTELKPVYTGETTTEFTEESVSGYLDDTTSDTSFGVPEITDPMNTDATGERYTDLSEEPEVDPIDTDNNPYIGMVPVYDPPSNSSAKSALNDGTSTGTSTTEESNETGTINTFERPIGESTGDEVTSGRVCTRNSDGSFDCPDQAVKVAPPSAVSSGGIRRGASKMTRNQSRKQDKQTSKIARICQVLRVVLFVLQWESLLCS